MPTTADIDIELYAAYWRLQHARWRKATSQVVDIRDEIDELLDRRLALADHPDARRSRWTS